MLAVQSLQAQQANDVNAENVLSFALWSIFYANIVTNPTCVPSQTTCNTQYGSMTYQQWSAAQTFASNALAAASSYASGAAYESAAGVQVTIYTPESGNSVMQEPSSGTRPQEFITVRTPEPAMLADLGFNLIGIGVIGLVFWRRQLRKPTS